MSGFSSAISGLSSGLGQGMIQQAKGKDDQLNYDALMQKKKQAEQQSTNNQTIFEQQQKLNDLKMRDLYTKQAKDTVDSTKKNFTPYVEEFVNAFSSSQKNGGLVDKIDPLNGKHYQIPDDLTNSVKDMKKALVYDPQGSDWINGFMAPKYGTDKNPINDVTYEPSTHQIILTQTDGSEIPMSPLMLTHALGLNKYMKTRTLDELNRQTIIDKNNYEKHKTALADLKGVTENLKVKNNAAKIASESKVNAEKANTEKIKAQEAIKRTELALKKLNGKALTKDQINAGLQEVNKNAYEIMNKPGVTKSDVKPIVDKLKSNKTYTDSLVKNQNTIYRKTNALKYFRDKSGELSKELNSMPDGAKTGSFSTAAKWFLKVTGQSLNEKEYLKANDTATRINLMVMDYLQYKSGAAFGAEELKGYQLAGGVLDFTSPAVAKSSLAGMHKYLADKLHKDIDAVPTASDRLVLSYDAGYYDGTSTEKPNVDLNSAMTTIKGFKTQEEVNKYAKDLQSLNPDLFKQIQAKLSGGQ